MAQSADGRETNENKQLGTAIEEYRAEERGGYRTPDQFYDVKVPDGPIVEVKSTEQHLATGRNGRYQLVEGNHRQLVEAGGVYDFVLRDDQDTAAERIGVPAGEVSGMIEEAGLKWPDGGKLKLTWTYVHDA